MLGREEIYHAILQEHLWCLALAVLLVQFLYWFAVSQNSPASLETLAKRMRGYAILKANGKECCSNSKKPEAYLGDDPRNDYRLFEVLLGTLKKVEQKNSVLTGVLIVAISLAAAGLSSAGDGSATNRGLLTLLLISLGAPLWLSFSGIRQVDQRDFQRHAWRKDDVVLDRLYRDLAEDLLAKERDFRFSKWSVQISFTLFIILFSLNQLMGAC
jgi:hypothetical protein